MNKERDNVILIGMPASGKSTVGVILAKILGLDFVDTDIVIQQREGARLQEIIESRGIDGFLQCEEAAVLGLAVSNTVVATGGSVVYSDAAMKHLAAGGSVVYLKVGFEDLKKRLKDIKERGVVLRPDESIETMYKTRTALYEKYADLTVAEEGSSIEDTVQAVMKGLRE
ncbi:MAG: shikimate kinase [Lachnospiraceae bacterium]|nr:shikimate kinase [Lachnospiraceae bacterium]